MNPSPTTRTRARLRGWLTFVSVLFIVYASLSPFSGWREQGLHFAEVLALPLRSTYTAFDAAINVAAYLPFGLLVCMLLREHLGAAASVALSLFLGILLSACMEYLQMYLPSRVSSNTDLLSNSAGTLAGALLAVRIISLTRLVAALRYWRSALFRQGRQMDFGLALLALWIFGQTNPSLPMLGNVFISEAVRQPFAPAPPASFGWWESAAVALNLLMLGTLMQTLLQARRSAASASLAVIGLVAAAKFLTAALLLKSWALLLWINGEAMLGMLLGMLLLLAVLRLPRTVAIAAGAMAALSYIGIVNFVLDSRTPSAATSIYHWHYRHLLTYNGLARTIALVFPALLLFHLWRVRKV